jgi:dTDP-4-dehydrorhamnose reductase
MFESLRQGLPFRCPDDTTVSPTYVPDLVHASLDLLIDGEHGLWHLANEGAATWYEFARMAVGGSNPRAALLVPSETAAVRGPARRPRHTPLVSSRGQLLRPLEDPVAAYLAAVPHITTAAFATGTDG